MPLERGPIVPLDAASLGITVSPAEFLGLENELTSDLEFHLQDLGSFVATAAAETDNNPSDEIAAAMSGTFDAVDEFANQELGPDLVDAQLAADETDDILIKAGDELPLEAYQEIPPPFEPPVDQTDFVEQQTGGTGGSTNEGLIIPPVQPPPLPPGTPPPAPPPQPQPAPQPQPQPPPQPGSFARTVSLTNLAKPNQFFFNPGDEFLLEITGPAFSPVDVLTFHNTDFVPLTRMGETDAAGRFSIRGQMSAAEIGHWLETWTIGGFQATPVLDFWVVP